MSPSAHPQHEAWPDPLKVLIALPSQGVYGGMEAFALTVADWLHREPGYSVRLCFKIVVGFTAQDTLRSRCTELGLDAVFCRRSSAALVGSIRWADVVHANNCSPDIVFPAKLLRKPVLLTVHNWRRPNASLHHGLWRLAHDAADHRTYNSRFVMDTWSRQRRCSASEVVPAVTHFGGTPVPVEARQGFFFIARWIDGKGIEDLIEAYGRASIDKDRWPLMMAGDGPLRANIVARLASKAVAGLSLAGFIPEAEKYRLMAHSKWLVCPPNTREDMGLTPIEARALGIPSIVTVDGGLPEAAGPYAIFCPPGDPDALARALELAAGMTDNAYRMRAEGAARTLDSYLHPLSVYGDLYKQIARGSASGAIEQTVRV